MGSPNISALGYKEFFLFKNQYYVTRLAFKINLFKDKKLLSKHSWKISAYKMYYPLTSFCSLLHIWKSDVVTERFLKKEWDSPLWKLFLVLFKHLS